MQSEMNAAPQTMTMQPLRVWLIDDDKSIRWLLERALRSSGIVPRSFDATEPALTALRSDVPDALITDICMSGSSGLDLLRRVHDTHPELPVIVMTAFSDLGNAVSAYESGAFEFLPKPFDVDHAVDLIRRATRTNARAAETTRATPGVGTLLGHAPAMQQVFRAIGRLSKSSVNVLITGESGTGKELVARALHEHSPRARRPFIALNTSAIPAELLESELFGHEKGAFTGADGLRSGRFEQANGGSLFLDEIGDMSLSLQTRLLRVLAEGEFYRVGGRTPICVDVRVVAATNQNLPERVRSGLFREDLFHRLNVIPIELPPLRSRQADIVELLEHYLKVAAQELGVKTKVLTAAARDRLARYCWPGNVRELVNLCRRVTVLAPGNEIGLEDLPAETINHDEPPEENWTAALALWAERQASVPAQPLLEEATPLFERTLIDVALRRTRGHRKGAAKLLGWGRNTLTRKLRELGMEDIGEETSDVEQADTDDADSEAKTIIALNPVPEEGRAPPVGRE